MDDWAALEHGGFLADEEAVPFIVRSTRRCELRFM